MLTIIQVLEIVSLVSVGIVTGSTFYSSMVEIPVRTKTSEIQQMENWRLVFPKASSLLKTMGNITMVLILLTWYLTKNTGWLIGAIPLFLLIPFTAIFIARTNRKIIAKKDMKGVSKIIRSWDKLHHVRTVLAIISFLICTVTLVLKHS